MKIMGQQQKQVEPPRALISALKSSARPVCISTLGINVRSTTWLHRTCNNTSVYLLLTIDLSAIRPPLLSVDIPIRSCLPSKCMQSIAPRNSKDLRKSSSSAPTPPPRKRQQWGGLTEDNRQRQAATQPQFWSRILQQTSFKFVQHTKFSFLK